MDSELERQTPHEGSGAPSRIASSRALGQCLGQSANTLHSGRVPTNAEAREAGHESRRVCAGEPSPMVQSADAQLIERNGVRSVGLSAVKATPPGANEDPPLP